MKIELKCPGAVGVFPYKGKWTGKMSERSAYGTEVKEKKNTWNSL